MLQSLAECQAFDVDHIEKVEAVFGMQQSFCEFDPESEDAHNFVSRRMKALFARAGLSCELHTVTRQVKKIIQNLHAQLWHNTNINHGRAAEKQVQPS